MANNFLFASKKFDHSDLTDHITLHDPHPFKVVLLYGVHMFRKTPVCRIVPYNPDYDELDYMRMYGSLFVITEVKPLCEFEVSL